MSLFQKLWALRGQSDAQTLEKMREVQAEMKERYLGLLLSED